MYRRRVFGRDFRIILFLATWLGMVHLARAQSLYDASLGTLPEAQGWAYGVVALITPTEILANDSVLLDTTLSLQTRAGWSEIVPADLNRTNGFTLSLVMQLNSESHTSNDRSGFSVIVLGDDKRGIELSFWTTNIFALTDNPLLTHAEGTNFTTTGRFVNYALTIRATNYSLQANGVKILTGAIRDYTGFVGPINPYETPNYLFFGDNTSSAAAAANVRELALITAPKLTMPAPAVLAWKGVSGLEYTIQSSTNLTTWETVGTAGSSTGLFGFTNALAAPAGQVFRVSYP